MGHTQKNQDAQQTAGGPRKIFNPNNEYYRSLPQSAFPVIFHGQAWAAKKCRATWHECMWWGHGLGGERALQRLRWCLHPMPSSGLPQPPKNCSLAKEPRDRGKKRLPVRAGIPVCPGPSSRMHVPFYPCLPAAGFPPLTPPSPPRAV